MTTTDEDADVFEITDFTTATDWERFIARLEEVLHEWNLINHAPLPPSPKGDLSSDKWKEKTDSVNFANFKFDITYRYLKRDDINIHGSNSQRSSPEDEEEGENDDQLPTVMADLMSLDNDFPSKAHCLCRWYGLQEFVVLSPSNQSDPILSESRTKILLSSVSIALHNAGCAVPMFIQVQQFWRQMFTGTCILSGSTIDFDVIHLKNIPSPYNHLAGLLDVFKAKIATNVVPRPTVTVAVRFTYILTDWVNSPWPQEPPDLSSPMEDEIGCSTFQTLPFGACEDPVSELQLACTWPSLSEDMIVENQNYSDLDPLHAPQWSVRIIMTEDPNCLLGKYLTEFLRGCHRKETSNELLWNVLSNQDNTDHTGDIGQALSRLTDPKVGYQMPAISTVVNTASSRLAIKPGQAPISQEALNEIVFYVFPDAQDKFKSTNDEEDCKETTEIDNKYKTILEELPKQLKSAPVDSLLHRLVVCLNVVYMNHGGMKGVAQLWQEFVLEMRYRWENKHQIIGIEEGAPNLGACLLYQKLQMLNCCIERKIKREMLYKGYTGESSETPDSDSNQDSGCLATDKQLANQNKMCKSDSLTTSSSKENLLCNSDISDQHKMDAKSNCDSVTEEIPAKVVHLQVESSSEDEEFFECDEESMEDELSPAISRELTHIDSVDTTSSSEAPFHDSVTHKPEGRQCRHGDLLLLHVDEPLFIPLTQEPSPMTEDMLEEHAEVLAKLGTSSEGAQLRARMQSACLVSDMESFKAANPGCVLEDFVRWYSPRDWIANDDDDVSNDTDDKGGLQQMKGHLSSRMQIPGNVWVEAWNGARPVPARRQKRLFDDTKEAEKVLHFLSSMKPADVIRHLLPMLIHSAIVTIVENEDSDIPKLTEMVQQLVVMASKVTRTPSQEIKRYEDLVRRIAFVETLIARARSLKDKFTADLIDRPDCLEEMQKFVCDMLHYPEVSVRGGPGGPAGSVIHKLFVAAQKEHYMITDCDSLPSTEHQSTVPDFPHPSAREYILRTTAPRPAPYSKTLPHKMYCSLMEGHEFRMAGAFASDSVFQ